MSGSDNPFAQFAPAKASGDANPFAQFKSEAPPAPPGRLARIGAELMQPVYGLEQIAGRILPIPAYENGKGWVSRATADDDAAKANQAKIDAARGGAGGVNWEQMGLDVVNPINYVGGPAGKALGVADRFIAPVAGAVAGASQPVTNGGDFLQQKADQALAGMAGGAGGEVLGNVAGKVIAPQLTGAAKALADKGIRLTPGQMAGGAVKRVEDAATSVPFVGSMVRGAQETSIHDFNRAAMNEGLQHIGAKVPDSVPAGREALNYMSDQIGHAYNRVIPNMQGSLDPQMQHELVQVMSLGKNLPPEDAAKLQRFIKHDVLAKFSQGGRISGEAAQEIGTKVDNQADAMMRDPNPDTRRLGTAIKEVGASVDRMVERNNPQYAGEKQKIDLAYAHYKTIERASAMQGAKDGVFTPAHLSNAIRTRDGTKDHSSYAKGNALMQGLSTDAEKVIPQKVGDSGTAERGAVIGGAAGLLGMAHPGVLATAAGTAGLYTKPGLRAARALATPSAGRTAAREALRVGSRKAAGGVGAATADALGVGQ